MDTFGFANHVPTFTFPKGDSFQFGNGYQFAAAPQLPLVRRFTLSFQGLIWYMNGSGVYDATIDPANNALAFVNFYLANTTYKSFIYPHPAFGNLICKFAADAPPEIGKSLPGGTGVTDVFDVFLVEQPA